MLRYCIATTVAVFLLFLQHSTATGRTVEILSPEIVDGIPSRIALVIGNNDYEFVTDPRQPDQ